jgi:hypothetical protein
MHGAALRAILGGASAEGGAAPALKSYLGEALQDGPVALWLLDGNALDSKGAFDAYEIGGQGYGAAIWGTAARCDHNDKRFQVDTPILTGANPRPYSLEGWVQPISRPGIAGRMVLQTSTNGSNSNMQVGLETDGKTSFDKNPPSGGTKFSARILTLGLPHQLAYVETAAGGFSLYINGELDASGTAETYSTGSPVMNATVLGNTITAARTAMAFLGRIGVYPDALSAARVRRHYYAGLGLHAYLHGRQGAGWAPLGWGGLA